MAADGTARKALEDVLAPLGYDVHSSRLPDHVGKPALAIFTDRVVPEGTGRMRRWYLNVFVLAAKTGPVDADDDLDVLLGKVLDAIDKAQPFHWTEVERGTANESFQSMKVAAYVLMAEE